VYCHDNEHQKQLELAGSGTGGAKPAAATHSPFADLKARLEQKK
jgi:hypothetical protein